jgi:amino-acid N-acetyltransferase
MSGQDTMSTGFQLLPVGPDGLTELMQALDRAGLPGDDVRLPGRCFFRAADGGGPVGFGGLEGDGPDLLLRSVVAHPDGRGRGHGAAIVRALEAQAAAIGAVRLHLLTTTAAGFFLRLGYEPAMRNAAPATITATAQFASLCPASATYLVKTLSRA